MTRLSALERYRRYGIVPVMAGGSEGATEAAPAEGGGEQTDNGSGLYAEALERVPEDLRPFVEEHFKGWDAQVTPKLMEAAELKKQYGPLSEIEGLTDIPAEELSELVAFREILADRDQLTEWLGQVNEAMGLTPGELDQDSWEALGEENGWFDDGEGGEEGPNAQSIVEQVMEQLKGELDPLKKFVGSQEQNQAAEKAKGEITERLEKLEAEHGIKDKSEEDKAERRDVIYQLALAQDGDDPIGAAVEQYLRITGQAAGEAVDGKLDQPNGSLSGGRPSTDAPHTSWAEGNGNVNPRDVALARMKQSA